MSEPEMTIENSKKHALSSGISQDSQDKDPLQQQISLNSLRNHALKLIANSRPLPEILYSIATGIEIESKGMQCSILLLDKATQTLTIGAAPSLPGFYNDAIDGIEIGLGVGACGTAAFLGERIITEDISQHEFWHGFTELAQRANLASCWSEPILTSSGEVVGTFAIYHNIPCKPNATDFYLIEQSANLISIAIELASANEKIWQQTNYDRLTGLANRQHIYNQLHSTITNAKNTKSKLAILHIDLDSFKTINNAHGYECGDSIIIDAATRISRSLNKEDLVARLGGDEFIIILNNVQTLDYIDTITKRLQLQLSKHYQVNNNKAYISASIGISVYPDDAVDTDNLFKHAEQAMHHAKDQGPGSSHFFDREIREESLKRQSLITDMRTALDNEEFYLVYQPIIDMKSGKITKVEALIRWQHPKLGYIPPLYFIPLAEEAGLINQIGSWVFRTAMEQIAAWRKVLNPQIKVAINTSPAQYKNDSLQRFFAYMQEHRLDPHSLVLEITEGMLIESTETVASKITQLRTAGVQVAIDDFGTGYASLSYLTKFKVDYLKIDKSFVWNMHKEGDDRIICEAVLIMAKRMGLKVVAEGVETQEQYNLLSQMQCDYGQGYHMSKPLRANEFEQYYFAHLIT